MSWLPNVAEPTAEEVRFEMLRILATSEFSASDHLTYFLRYVVDESLAGRDGDLKERSIAINALNRENDFDPRLDCVVRVVAGKLRRALERYYATDGAENPVRIEVPKGAYRPLLRRNVSVAKLDRTITAESRTGSETTSDVCAAGYPVVAVVPFATFSRDERDRFIADSVAERLSVRLSKISWFRVVDFLSARTLPAQHCHPREIAQQLHADYFLTGAVWRTDAAGQKITIKLAQTDNALIIWADEFEVPAGDGGGPSLDAVMDRVVAAVGDLFGVLASAVSSAARRKPIGNLSAVEAVLRQMQYQTSLADELHVRTRKTVERAVRDNPDFAWGWSALATLYVDDIALLANGGCSDSAERCRECLRRALLADPTSAYAHWNVALYELVEGRIEESLEAIHRALECPTKLPFEVGAIGTVLNALGEVHEGQPLINQALHSNPGLPGWMRWGTVLGQLAQDNANGAVATTQQFSMPGCFWDPLLRAVASAGVGKFDEKLVKQAIRLRPQLAERPRELGAKIVKRTDTLDQVVDCVARYKSTAVPNGSAL